MNILEQRISQLEKQVDNLMTLILERTRATDDKFEDRFYKLEGMIDEVRDEIPSGWLTKYDLEEYAEQYDLDNLDGRVDDLEKRVSDLE